jgi:hypothetical protein
MHRIVSLLAFFAGALAVPVPAAEHLSRTVLSLDGTWQFQLAGDQEVESIQPAASSADFPHRIQVPGNWQAQGFGQPRGIARHDYQGKAWYRRSFTVPDEWSGRRIWLRFEGVCNWGDVFVDGTKVGRVDSFVTPQEFDVTEHVGSGKEHRLYVLVDSRTPPDAPYVGMMQFLVASGGITSHVRLEARSDPRLDRIALRAEPGLKGVLAGISVGRSGTSDAWQGTVRVRVLDVDGGVAAEGELSVAIPASSAVSTFAELRLPMTDLHPWSPDDPRLYHVDASLRDASGNCEGVTIRTGFRTMAADRDTGNFLLNGKPFFLRGCGYDSLEPIHGSPPPDKAMYVERLRRLKDCGFNAIRFLAHTPLDEFFQAADEAGMLVQTEGEWFMGGTPMKPATAEILKSQVPQMIREFENHPCWYSFSCFNEAFNAHLDSVKQAYITDARETFRAMKPDHFFVASDGGGDQWPTDIITDRWVMPRADGAAQSSQGPQQVFRGQVEEVALFHRALDQDAIRLLAAERPQADVLRNAAVKLHAAARWPQRIEAPGVSVAGQAREALPARGQPLTIAAWVKPERFEANDWGTFFSCGTAETGRALIIGMDGTAGDGRICVGRYWDNILQSRLALAKDAWNHVAISYDGRWIRLWIGGTLDSEFEGALDLPPEDIAIGRLVDRAMRTPVDYASRPHVWHEFDNTYIAPLPDLDKESRLTGVMTQAWVLEPHRRRLESYGLLQRYGELRARSIARYREYVKAVFERARWMPRLDGYAWWVVSDIPGGVETDVTDYGILDMVYQNEKFDAAWFRTFNRESVLLIDADTDQRVLATGETREVRLALSHFGNIPIEGGQLTWRVSDGKTTLSEGHAGPLNVACAAISDLAHIPFGPFELSAPAQLELTAEIDSAACRQNNKWSFWVFPARKPNAPRAGIANLTGSALLDSRYAARGSRSLDGQTAALATSLTPELLTWVQSGGSAILLESNRQASSVSRPAVVNGSFSVPSTVLQHAGAIPYWPLWLRCDSQWVETHPALRDFPHNGISGFQFMRLFSSGVPTVDFTPREAATRKHFQPIMAGMSLIPWAEDASRFNYALAYGAMLSECRIGAGRVIVCNLWLLDGIDRGYPEAGYLLDCLASYAASEMPPVTLPELSADEAKTTFRITATNSTEP